VTSERDRLLERRDLVRRDLLELTEQQEIGEVAVDTAERLRRTYESELETLDSALGQLPDPATDRSTALDPEGEEEPARPPSWRKVAGSVLVIGALVTAILVAAQNVSSEADQAIGMSPGQLTVDPASVSNEELEAVVAANPNINGMRMALADRYFAAEEYGKALDHYLIIAENQPTPSEEGKVLARIGWIAYRTGLPESAEQYVSRSLAVDPANAEARLYIGFITFYGLGDTETAIPQLEAALEIPNLSSNVISQIEAALDEARAGATP
jgi:tetratricopeptide (TPR) repeat protein